MNFKENSSFSQLIHICVSTFIFRDSLYVNYDPETVVSLKYNKAAYFKGISYAPPYLSNNSIFILRYYLPVFSLLEDPDLLSNHPPILLYPVS
jgi:hypothetical protein